MSDTSTNETLSTKSKVIIRPVEARDYAAWMDMWHSYCTFYEVSLPEDVTDTTWARILDSSSTVKALIATNAEGDSLGFANYILQASTWSKTPICLLDDLFVRFSARKQGVGRMLIEHLIQLAHAMNWGQLYWMTREENVTARRLYNQFTESDGFVRYVLSFDEVH